MSTNPSVFTLGHRPALDGFRGLAILLVVPFNLGWGLTGGYIGVDLFFVLSGFLITSLLIQERSRAGRIDFGAFYMRRILRLIPALLFLLAALTVTTTVLSSPADARENYLASLAALFYVANWVMALGVGDGSDVMGALAHTWSLSVEEQFYLIWPPILATILIRGWGLRGVAVVAGVGSLGALLWRVSLSLGGAHPVRIYTGTDTRADALLLGCLLACIFHLRKGRPLMRSAGSGLIAVLALTVIVLGAFRLPSDASPVMQQGGFTAVAIVAVLLLAHLVDQPAGRLGNAFSWMPLVVVGKLSYGVYLWHLLVGRFLTADRLPLSGILLETTRVVAIACVVAFSWHFVERPALTLKERWTRATPDHGISEVVR